MKTLSKRGFNFAVLVALFTISFDTQAHYADHGNVGIIEGIKHFISQPEHFLWLLPVIILVILFQWHKVKR